MIDGTDRGHVVWHLDWKLTIERTIRAVSSQDCRITDFVLDQQEDYDYHDNSGFCTDNITPQLNYVCSQLSSLEVTAHHHDIHDTAESIRRIVSAAKTLKHLHLWDMGGVEYSIGDYIPDILRSVTPTSLETITFAMTYISLAELVAFLRRQKGTLRELRMLQRSRLLESCMSLIAWIKDNLHSLVYLELNEICDDAPSWADEKAKSYWVTHGEDMQTGLADILDGKINHKYTVENIGGIPHGVMINNA